MGRDPNAPEGKEEDVKGSIAEVGPYRIEEEIGRGGMATVYRGVRRSPHGHEQPVAVKVLDPELAADKHLVTSFHAEAELARRLGHRVLVPVLDHGTVEGVHYMAMDLLEGETLSTLRKRYSRRAKGFPLGHALYIMAEVLEGLHYAHELAGPDGKAERIVHRDVSPRNIIVTRTGAVRLLDFGIARFESRPTSTQVGIVKGTVPYMSPEQARAEPLDRRSDLFAAAMVLHELITGESPIADGNTDTQRQAIAAMEVKPASRKIHLSLRPTIEKALAANPDDRFATAADFATALRAALGALEPDHDPFLLGCFVDGIRRRESAPAANDDAAESPDAPAPKGRRRGKNAIAPLALARKAMKEHVESLELEGPLPPIPIAPTLGLCATVMVLAALCYTFVTSVV